MIPVWLIAAIALLRAVCLALPLHIGMTGVCLLLLAAVLTCFSPICEAESLDCRAD